ncbi:hypothetical protein HWV62_3785 [Athelia sp. TMB]|nr:hypothetical protein HWV62_3785 [Athelia sp. TMB]
MATFNTTDAAARAKVNNYGGSRTSIHNHFNITGPIHNCKFANNFGILCITLANLYLLAPTVIVNGPPNQESADVPLPGPTNGGSTQRDVENFYRDLAAAVRAMDPAADMGAMEAQVEPSSLDQQRPLLRRRRTIPQIFSQFAYALRLRRPTTSRRSALASQAY